MIGITIVLFISLITTSFQQVAPTWISSPFMDIKLFYVTDNVTLNAQTLQTDVFYSLNFIDPYVVLSLNDIRIVSNNNNFGFRCSISGLPANNKFTAKTQIFEDTRIHTLRIRYLAYENNRLGSFITTIFPQELSFFPINGNTNPPSARTYSQLIGYPGSLTFPITNDIICSIYMTGFTGTDNYQANISCIPYSATQVQLVIAVSIDTIIIDITVYMIVVDRTSLKVASEHFVDYGVTQAKQGVSYTFFRPPYGTYSNGLFMGLRSFSIRDNYQFNYSISDNTQNTTFVTQASQYYIDSSNFQIRVRICGQNPFTFYNKVDGLCYNQCPNTTYKVQVYTLCQPCDYTCATCSDAVSCDTCKVNRVKDPSTNLCPCANYYYEFNQECIACHYSCETCSNNQNFNCLTCEASDFRTFNSTTGKCPCDTGYHDIGVSLCSPLCGDGVLRTNECDDGNTVNGDGCSSQCKIQANFTCLNEPSQCFYKATLQLTIQKIQKDQYTNTAKFYVKMTPYIDLLAKLAGTNSLVTNLTFMATSVFSESPYIVYTGVYGYDIQGLGVQIFLKPTASGPFSQIPPVNTTFFANATKSLRLLYYQQAIYTGSLSMQSACSILSYIIIACSIFFSIGTWKLIGTQTYFIMQFMFMSIVIIPHFSPFLAALGNANMVMGYNGLLGQNQTQYFNKPAVFYMGYSTPYQFNVNFMVIPQGIALIMYIFYKIFQRFNQKRIKQGQSDLFENWCGKIIRVFRFQFFVYWTFINANQFLFATVLQTQSTLNPASWALAVPCLLSLVVCILAVIISPKDMASYRTSPFHKKYGGQTFLLQLLGLAVINISFLIGVLITQFIFYVSFVVPIFFIVFAIVRRPFKSNINLGRFIANYSLLAICLCLTTALLNSPQMNALYVPIGILICIILTFLINLVIFIVLLVMSFIDSDKKQLKSQTQEEELKEMRKIMKQQENSKMRQNTPRKPLMDYSQIEEGSVTKRTIKR